ncbi:hypothetical protein T492DRAFT_894254 [Pavlovales sp. CCMP2436]|nr:hypothetical protein T492DRAFT_894254 [Pavlovales sp. CCMP2436]
MRYPGARELDHKQAARLWRQAAEQFALGSYLEAGQGLAEDHPEAARLYGLAAEQVM